MTDEFQPSFVQDDDPPPIVRQVKQPIDAPVTAQARLRAFEDETLGKDAVRISGQVEKGHGSHFKTKLTDHQRKHHAALERLVAAEKKLADASALLAAAEAAHEKAQADVAASEGHVDGDEQPE